MNANGPDSGLMPRLVAGLIVSMIVTCWCWWATGPGLGLFFGATLLTSIFLPPLVLAADGTGRVAMLGTATGVISLMWLAATRWADVTAYEWLRCSIVLAAFSWGITGIVSMLAATGIAKSLAAGVAVIAGLLWLTWPVWLSHALTQPLVNWLVPAHPVLAINSVLKHLGTWDRTPLAYNMLTVLNQDVAYRLPTSIVPAVLIHLAIGTPGVWLVLRNSRRPAEAATATAPPPEPG